MTRQHFVGQNLGAYLLAKFTVLMPFLLLVVLLLILVLRVVIRSSRRTEGVCLKPRWECRCRSRRG